MSEMDHDQVTDGIDHDVDAPDAESVTYEPTGHARIDAALDRLAGIDQQEITSHPEEFDAIHQVLRESLAHAGRDEDPADTP